MARNYTDMALLFISCLVFGGLGHRTPYAVPVEVRTMLGLNFILILLAFLCFMACAIGVKSSRVNLQALGLALWVLSLLIGR